MHVGAGVACCVVAAICVSTSLVPESPAQADDTYTIAPLRIDPAEWGDVDPCIYGEPADQTYYADGTPAPALPCAVLVIPFGPQQ
jgi:hypothetical protein